VYNFLDGCLLNNLNSHGSDTYSVIANVPDMFSCQYKCKMDSNCMYFTHGKVDQYCYLKNGSKAFVDDPLAISGPKDCSPFMTGNNLTIL
jgi:hypothetical protein